MADGSGGGRPLSPHLTIYRPQITSVLSIFHRVTGLALALGMALIVWWLLAAATGPEAFAAADWFLTSILGVLILVLSAAAFFYHLCNGIRHLWWDTGRGLKLPQVQSSGIAVLIATGILTLILLLAS